VDPVQADRVLAGGLAAAAVVEISLGGDPAAVWIPAALVMTLSLAVRRRHPLAVALVVTGADTVAAALTAPPQWASVAIAWMCALYGLAVWTRTRAFVAGTAATAASIVVVGQRSSPEELQTWLVAAVAALIIVRLVVRRRDERAALQARDAAADERARIARELHDVVGHSVSVMVVQAGAERRVTDRESTREALEQIEKSGRQALSELRRMLGVLRGGEQPADRSPTPDLDELDALVAAVREAGLSVDVRREGAPVPLAPGLGLTAYRIVQEGLTNALKHAGASRVEVVVRYAPGELGLDILDDGPGGAVNGSGHGLAGMRERVALYGGRIEAGTRHEGGFALRARLPL
jgi:signal transduction histidine kinase